MGSAALGGEEGIRDAEVGESGEGGSELEGCEGYGGCGGDGDVACFFFSKRVFISL